MVLGLLGCFGICRKRVFDWIGYNRGKLEYRGAYRFWNGFFENGTFGLGNGFLDSGICLCEMLPSGTGVLDEYVDMSITFSGEGFLE